VAESWERSADGLTYTFHLREGAKWSDGKPVVAGDFEWAWKRNVDPRTASAYATSLAPLRNAERILAEELPPDDLGVNAQDDRTLVVTLERPAVHFLRLASTWPLMPLRRDVLERHGGAWTEAGNIVTNGPFLLRQWAHEQQLVLERNDAYWGPLPALQRVSFAVYSRPSDALADYEAGKLDALGTGMSLPEGVTLSAETASGAVAYAESGTSFLVLNARHSPTDDARVRKALGMAIDREELIRQALGGDHAPAYSLQPPGIDGSNPALWPSEDVGAARHLLAEAGYPGGKGLTLRYAYNPTQVHGTVADYLQRRWKETLGLKLDLVDMDWDTFVDFPRTSAWVQDGDIFPGGGWSSDYEDPANWYNLLWDSAADATQFNTGWRDDRYDDLVRRAIAESDPDQRLALYGQAEQVLADSYPSIPLYYAGGRTLVKPYVHGLEPSRLLGILPLETITVDPR
jgi:oligopeptide transport system substrate-binding protein